MKSTFIIVDSERIEVRKNMHLTIPRKTTCTVGPLGGSIFLEFKILIIDNAENFLFMLKREFVQSFSPLTIISGVK